MATELKWYGTEIANKLESQVSRGTLLAAEHLKDAMQVKVSEEYPPASLPGNPPHWRTGNLQAAIKVMPIDETRFLVEGEAGGFAVGVDLTEAYYALYLEFGTKKMAPRPFITKTALEEMSMLATIIGEEAAKAKAAEAVFVEEATVAAAAGAVRERKGIFGRAAEAVKGALRRLRGWI